MAETTDTGYAPDRWEFDGEVSRVFDDMLERSIPQYDLMREAVTSVACAFLLPGSRTVVDLGCSRGGAIAALAELPATEDVAFVGLEISEPMLKAARARFIDDERVLIWKQDLREPIAWSGNVDVILSVLTLMFVPVNYRQRLLADCHVRLAERRGGIVLVEKVLGDGPRIDDLLNANYHRKKVEAGYTPDEISRKRLSLEGVLVPMTLDWNVQMLRRAGFSEIDVFWRWMNFAGIVATY